MKKVSILIIISICISSMCFAQGIRVGGFPVGRRVPVPILRSPISEEVVLTGKEVLGFRWSPHERVRSGITNYDFRLYKGLEMVESTLMHKELIPGNKHKLAIKADKFQNGQTYTWSLRIIVKGVGKGERSHSSFKVVK